MSETAAFNRYAGDFGGPNFNILFANASFHDVLAHYAEDTGARADASVFPVELTAEHNMPPIGVVASVKDCNWCIIFHRVGQFDDYSPSKLSNSLKCDIIAFKAEGTSGLTGCERYYPDGSVVRYFEPEDKETDESLAECCGIEAGPAETISSYAKFFDENGIRVVELFCGQDRTVAATQDDLAQLDNVAVVGDCPWNT